MISRASSSASLDPLRNFDFLFGGQERDLAHLPQVHFDRIVQCVETGPFRRWVIVTANSSILVRLLDDFDLQCPELGADCIDFRWSRGRIPKDGIYILVGQVPLLARHAYQFTKFVAMIRHSTKRGCSWRSLSGTFLSFSRARGGRRS